MRSATLESLTFAKVRQHLATPRIEDARAEVLLRMRRMRERIRPGMSVAVTAGSRGIHDIPLLLRAVVDSLRGMGAYPFIVAAMGSHGGDTAAGQKAVLHHLGLREETVGAPFRITSESAMVGRTDSGQILHMDAEALKADAIFLVNRVKPHTAFQARLASGLVKMLTVGLGKAAGSAQVHELGPAGMYPALLELSRLAFRKLSILGGLAIVENGYEETAAVECLFPEEMEEGEARLLRQAARLLPRLPVSELDLLIVEEMGKDFSGTGMDTNVIGRWRIGGFPEPELPRISRIVVLALSKGSEGNANGIGLADFTTRRLAESIDWSATLTNVRTTGFWARAACPPFPGSDREAIAWALESLRLPPKASIRAARIRNTLHLEELWLSADALQDASGCKRVGPFRSLAFDADGLLLPEDPLD